MQNQQVNVHDRALRAAARTMGVSGTLQPQMQRGEPEPLQPWWKQYFRWENLTVAGRNIEKGWVVPQPLGIALLLVILGGVGSLYWRITDKQIEADKTATARYMEQREMMIRLDQRFIDKDIHDNQERKQIKEHQELHALQIQDLKDKLLVANIKRSK